MANGIGERWKSYQPSKGTIVWSFAGGAVATMVLGFAYFNWTTAGGAREMADNAAAEAQAQLASAICVERFITEANAPGLLTKLKAESSWSRDTFIEDGGWVTIAGIDDPIDDAADLCADALVEMEMPTTEASNVTLEAS